MGNLDIVRSIAERLPTGVIDHECAKKLAMEMNELQDELSAGRLIDALTELADVCYYAYKSVLNDRMSLPEAEQLIASTESSCNVISGTAMRVMQAKYESRIRIGKNKDAEREAVRASL